MYYKNLHLPDVDLPPESKTSSYVLYESIQLRHVTPNHETAIVRANVLLLLLSNKLYRMVDGETAAYE